ncbi:hypothetical protein N7530_004650 [Penicillium desertorum]|uniref:Uncharacterized protein n=1 Tax=Penicillium desertorum TaxID=1303715 RepID=A0A9W9WYL9_9EURO|nr:hypothetical protein N7530_004650 [Penicillium desertorum]
MDTKLNLQVEQEQDILFHIFRTYPFRIRSALTHPVALVLEESQKWKSLNVTTSPTPVPPILQHSLRRAVTCYKRYRETLTTIARMEYERVQLTTRLWQFYEEAT